MTKQCTQCHKLKDQSEFHKKGGRLHSNCKKCVSAQKKHKYLLKQRKKKSRGVRQIQLDQLKIITSTSGDSQSPTSFEEQYELLRSFVLEEVILGKKDTGNYETG